MSRETTARPSASRRDANRIAVNHGAEPQDWQDIYNRLNDRAAKFSAFLFGGSVMGSTFFGLFAALGVLAYAARHLFPDISIHSLACLVCPPAFLVGAAAGQKGGNIFMRLWFSLSEETRRGFATRLTLGRAPAKWPATLRRWLFTGDWMTPPHFDARLPYVRIFVMGDSPATCKDEDELWREIHGEISGDTLWEAGANHREISYPRHLPSWAKNVGKGEGLDDLKSRIGDRTAVDWVTHLWRRACKQWPALNSHEYPLQARRECFEIHSLVLSDGREALVVVLRPSNLAQELAGIAGSEDELAA